MKMPQIKFKIGDTIYHTVTKKKGVIVDYVNKDDAEDVRLQGYRYIVELRSDSGLPRSVLEENLVAVIDTRHSS